MILEAKLLIQRNPETEEINVHFIIPEKPLDDDPSASTGLVPLDDYALTAGSWRRVPLEIHPITVECADDLARVLFGHDFRAPDNVVQGQGSARTQDDLGLEFACDEGMSAWSDQNRLDYP